MLDVVGVPVHRLVGGQELVLHLGRPDVPVRLRVVEERRLAAPAVGVGVLVVPRAQETAGLAECLDDPGVGVADVHAGEGAGALVEGAVRVHRVVDREAVLSRQAEVVLAERGAGVHHAGAVLDRDEVAGEDGVALLAVVGDVGERRLVAQAQQLRPGEARGDLRALPERTLDQRLGHDQDLTCAPLGIAHLRAHVGDLGIHGDRRVRQQRPRHSGPRQQRGAGLLEQREAHVDARVDDVLVAQRHLVARERRAAARAVGHHLVALVQQPLVPHLLQRPPDRLDVGVLERVVGVVGVDPEADPLGELRPLVDVAQHRLAALGVELGHAVALDVLLRLEAELLLDLELDRQAVAVPPALAPRMLAAHRVEAREHVLEHATEHVVRAGAPVGGGRALVEHVGLGALAAADRLVEHVALAPALENPLLEGGERLLRIDGVVAGHADSECMYAARRRACGRSRRGSASRPRRAPRTRCSRGWRGRGRDPRPAPGPRAAGRRRRRGGR